MNLINVIKCQEARALRNIWKFLQTNVAVRGYVFEHHKLSYSWLRYYMVFGEKLNFRKPSSFHEKLFWLSAKWRNPLIMKCADKYLAREYVKECGCGDILNTLFGVYDKAEEIDFDSLPKSFVIKSNKGSGDNLFVLDKKNVNYDEFTNTVNSWRSNSYGIETAEYQYHKIPFKIVCEKYLLENPDDKLIEYQLFCFNGEPHSFLVRNDLETSGKNPFAVSYSLNWERLFLRKNEEKFDIAIPEPKNRKKMIDYARKLAKQFPHVRVDFYEVRNQLFFGELTFSTHGNVLSNYKEETLNMWNRLLRLPKPYHKSDRY